MPHSRSVRPPTMIAVKLQKITRVKVPRKHHSQISLNCHLHLAVSSAVLTMIACPGKGGREFRVNNSVLLAETQEDFGRQPVDSRPEPERWIAAQRSRVNGARA